MAASGPGFGAASSPSGFGAASGPGFGAASGPGFGAASGPSGFGGGSFGAFGAPAAASSPSAFGASTAASPGGFGELGFRVFNYELLGPDLGASVRSGSHCTKFANNAARATCSIVVVLCLPFTLFHKAARHKLACVLVHPRKPSFQRVAKSLESSFMY